MAKLYVQTVQPVDVDLNKNTEWFMYPGVWTTYILILFFSWLLVLSIFGCTPGMAWTVVNLFHFAVTYHFFHWKKGTPFAEDQVAVMVLVVAKLPNMHRVRILGINADH